MLLVLNRAIISKILIFFGFFIFLYYFYTNSQYFALNFIRVTVGSYIFVHFPLSVLTGVSN